MSPSFLKLSRRAKLRISGQCAVLLVLSLVPSIGTVGYFNSLVTAPLAALWGMYLGQRHRGIFGQTPGERAQVNAAPEMALLILGWLAVLALSQIWNPSCAFWSGLAFWLLGPICSLGLGWGVAQLGQGLSPWRALPYLVFGACTIWGLARLYLAPVVFAFDPFWSYFSGPIYDEVVQVESRYVLYRAYNVLWLGALAAWVRFKQTRSPKWLTLGICGTLIAAYLATDRSRWGWSASKHSLSEALSLQRKTTHFVIHYAPHSSTAAQIDALALEHEFAWHRLKTKLGYEPPSPIDSFVFSSPGQKRRLFGAGRVEVSLPWRQQIYLNHQDAPHRILHHELAHAFGRSVGDNLFGLSRRGFALNGGLIEGYATALAPRSVGDLDLHDQAAIVDRIDKRPPLRALMGLGFWRYGSSRAYTSAGSFCLWLIEHYGPEALSRVYQNGGDFEAVLELSLEQLEAQWLAFLRARPVDDEKLAVLRARFSRRSVFDRPCAHKIAVSLQKVSTLSAQGRQGAAGELLRELCRVDPGELTHQIRLARFLANHQDPKGSNAVLQTALHRGDLRVRQRAQLLGVRADLAWRQGQSATAQESIDQALQLSIPHHQRRVFVVKKHALSLPETAKALVRRYFDPAEPHESFVSTRARRLATALALGEQLPNDSLGPYLEGLVWLSQDAPTPAAKALKQALKRALWPDPLLKSYALQMLRRAALRNLDLETAAMAHAQLRAMPSPSSGETLRNQLWDQRLHFARQFLETANSPNAPHEEAPASKANAAAPQSEKAW